MRPAFFSNVWKLSISFSSAWSKTDGHPPVKLADSLSVQTDNPLCAVWPCGRPPSGSAWRQPWLFYPPQLSLPPQFQTPYGEHPKQRHLFLSCWRSSILWRTLLLRQSLQFQTPLPKSPSCFWFIWLNPPIFLLRRTRPNLYYLFLSLLSNMYCTPTLQLRYFFLIWLTLNFKSYIIKFVV